MDSSKEIGKVNKQFSQKESIVESNIVNLGEEEHHDYPQKNNGVFFINPQPKTRREKIISYLKLSLLALPWIGVQAIWSAEFGTTTPYLQELGLSEQWASQIWLSGPLMGFFVAPIVGSLSDNCSSKWGRRRPFMLGGILLLGIVSTLLACSKYFGSAALPVAMCMFIIMDGVINVIQTPLRALIADFAPAEQQATGQLMAVCFQGVGGIVGYLLQKYMWTDTSDVLGLFLVVFALNMVLVLTVCFLVKEEQYARTKSFTMAEPFVNLFRSLKGVTFKLLIVGSCVFFCWFALFSWWPTSSTWYMEIVYDGCCEDPTQPYDGVCTVETYNQCQQGRDVNSTVNILANVAQLLLGVTFGILMNKGILVRVRFIWSAFLSVGCAIMICSKFVPEVWMAWIVGILIAVPISAINAFPFAIVGKYNKDDGDMDVGAQFGILNLFIVIPQIICTLMIGQLREHYGNDGLSWALFGAGLSFGVAAVIALFIKEHHQRV